MVGESGGREENDESDDDDGSSVNVCGVVDCVANKKRTSHTLSPSCHGRVLNKRAAWRLKRFNAAILRGMSSKGGREEFVF